MYCDVINVKYVAVFKKYIRMLSDDYLVLSDDLSTVTSFTRFNWCSN